MGRSSTVPAPQQRDAGTKLAQSRLSVLELAKELGNVAEACRQRGLDRTSFYEWKRRFQTQASAVQLLNTNVLIGVVVLNLVSSLLIVWLYVGRNLIRRLTALSDSMLAIAAGNLRAPLPATSGGDEISRMAEALVAFRDTAIEVEETNLRDKAPARWPATSPGRKNMRSRKSSARRSRCCLPISSASSVSAGSDCEAHVGPPTNSTSPQPPRTSGNSQS